jgi:hypothetical protein
VTTARNNAEASTPKQFDKGRSPLTKDDLAAGGELDHPDLSASNSYIADGEKQAVNGSEEGLNGVS